MATEHTTGYFSTSYEEARSRFVHSCVNKGGRHFSLPISVMGPEESALSVDIAWFGAEVPKRVLLHSSGLHGVEGFAGSAIQLERMHEDPLRLAADDAIIFVHVLNPYGMAWHRRVNENNVDLNRNFLPAGRPYRGASDGYHAMATVLNPTSPPGFDFFMLRAGTKIIQHGYNTLKQAITEGQYSFEKGLFFGGRQLEEGPRKYIKWLENHLGTPEKVVAIDIHTGLGKRGVDTLLVDLPSTNPTFELLRTRFGDRVASWDAEQSVAYQIHGGHPSMLPRILPDTTVQFITQEFGTIPALKVLHALREENRWHHFGDGTLNHSAKTGILNAFRPSGNDWKEDIVRRGAELYNEAKSHLFSNA